MLSQSKKIKFYKYQPLLKKEHIEFVEGYFQQKIWLTPLRNFNDPFEGRFQLAHPPSYFLNDQKAFDSLLHRYKENGEPNITARMLRERLSSPDFHKQLKPTHIKDVFAEHGALCLTTENDSIPMWAYYANDQKGCCIEFELDFSVIQENNPDLSIDKMEAYLESFKYRESILSFNVKSEPYKFVFVKVGYEDEIPTIELDKVINIADEYSRTEYIVKNSVSVKSKSWAHESEFRLTATANSERAGLLYLPKYAPFLKVTGVIVGCRVSVNLQQQLKCLSEKYQMNLYKAESSETSYAITISLAN